MRTLEYGKDRSAFDEILARRQGEQESVDAAVREVLEDVRRRKDEALIAYAMKFDGCPLNADMLRVQDSEIREAYRRVGAEYLPALRRAIRNVTAFHRRQVPKSWTFKKQGAWIQQRYLPIDRVGIYVPGGKGAYLSTVVMNAVPAAVAGVKEIAMVSPAGPTRAIAPEVLVAAAESGVTEIYRVGGAQAIAALAYGTETIRAVDKITGPGNAYVASAKKQVFGVVGIDMIAGPTEVVIVADEHAPLSFVAADIIAQAEHDERATALCITTSRKLVQSLNAELERQLASAPRRTIAAESIERNGAAILVRSLQEAQVLVNRFAPEHLEVLVRSAAAFARGIRHAGSIFLGNWSMEALGDYAAGPNHTLPTSGTARFSSPLGVHDFVKFSNVIQFSRTASKRLAPIVELLAGAEGFPGHAASAKLRRTTR